MDDHLGHLDQAKEKYMQERDGPQRFREATDRRKKQERGRGLGRNGPKGPEPER